MGLKLIYHRMPQNNNKSHKKPNQYLWLGVSLGVLLLIVLLIVVPNTKHDNSTPRPTDTTKQTKDSPEPIKENDKTESNSTEPTTTAEPDPTPSEPTPSSPQPTPTPQTPTTYNATPTCLHEEAGRCWDDLEDEAYSAGAYDHEYGYYGASLDYADDCDALCRDILEDTYDEGWADARY